MEVLPLTIEPTEEQKAEARRSQILYKPSSEEVFRAIIPEYVAGHRLRRCVRERGQRAGRPPHRHGRRHQERRRDDRPSEPGS